MQNVIRLCSSSNIISENWSFLINLQLSSLLRNYRWNLVFNSEVHGRTFDSLFIRLRRLEREYPSIMIIQTMCGQVFGVFIDENFKRKREYYGNGKSFIFKLVNDSDTLNTFEKQSYLLNEKTNPNNPNNTNNEINPIINQ